MFQLLDYLILFTQCLFSIALVSMHSILLSVWFHLRVDMIKFYTNSTPIWFNSDRSQVLFNCFVSYSIPFRWIRSSNFCFLYDWFNQNRMNFNARDLSLLCKEISRLDPLVQNYIRNWSFADSLINQFDWICMVWDSSICTIEA